MKTRFIVRSATHLRPSPPLRHFHASIPTLHQANPIGDYYTSILESSSPSVSSKPPTTAQPPISPTTSDAEPSILFSSRLSSPLERRSEIMKKSTLQAGVWVPPRPEEPDNCCMSGCVNCVYDRYREELEEWAAATKKAEVATRKEKGFEGARRRRKEGLGNKLEGERSEAVSMDDDGGRSEGLWGSDRDESEELFKDIPVGIREFMKQEKRLKEKHAREGSSGG